MYEKAYFVSGMQRSGNHAIINWMTKQMDGPVTFLNNREPWREAKPLILSRDVLRNKGNLVVSYEDFNYDKFFADKQWANGMKNRENEAFGNHRQSLHVLILRDPFNLFASRLFAVLNNPKIRARGKAEFKRKIRQKMVQSVDTWKSHAKIYLQMLMHGENPLDEPCTGIRYDRWFADRSIRRDYADMLDIEFTDKGVQDVPKSGNRRSSFDDAEYDGKAQDMDVMNRWKMALDHPKWYHPVFEDPEVWDLSERIFGSIEGTEILK